MTKFLCQGCITADAKSAANFMRSGKKPQFKRSQKFLALLHDWDREQAQLWLERIFPPEKPTKILRDTGGSLFSSAIHLAKANGDFAKAEAVLNYHLPCANVEGRNGRVDLTCFDDAVFIGDSRTEGLFLNTGLSNATSFAHMGLMVDAVFTRPLFNVNGEKAPVIGAMKKVEFSKVCIMLGINETGWAFSAYSQHFYYNLDLETGRQERS